MLAEIPTEEFTATLEDCADGLLWEAEITTPPVDAFLLAGRLGISVACNETMTGRARYMRRPDRSSCRETIVLGPDPRAERRHWAVAHEIGESVAHRVFAKLGIPVPAAPVAAREQVANLLASCLLLPRRWFLADGGMFDWGLYLLKERYRTASHELIARRMLQMPIPVVMTVCDQGRVLWRRHNLPGTPPRMDRAERSIWQRSHKQAEPLQMRLECDSTGLQRIHCWPVHEPGWRREIVRSEVATCELEC